MSAVDGGPRSAVNGRHCIDLVKLAVDRLLMIC